MTRPSRTMADTRRRRASTGRMMDEIMELARSLPLTRQVLADSLETATPAQMEFMLSWMNEELASRERSKRARLLKQAGLPGVKELDGYDWTPVRFPVDYGREALESLVFLFNRKLRFGGGDVLLDFVVCMVVGQCTGWFQATSPSWMRLSMMLMPYSVLMRLSRYQTMYSSSIAVNSSIVTPRKLLLWKNSCLRRPKNPSAAALSGEQPFALIDRVSPCSVQMRIHSGHR